MRSEWKKKRMEYLNGSKENWNGKIYFHDIRPFIWIVHFRKDLFSPLFLSNYDCNHKKVQKRFKSSVTNPWCALFQAVKGVSHWLSLLMDSLFLVEWNWIRLFCSIEHNTGQLGSSRVLTVPEEKKVRRRRGAGIDKDEKWSQPEIRPDIFVDDLTCTSMGVCVTFLDHTAMDKNILDSEGTRVWNLYWSETMEERKWKILCVEKISISFPLLSSSNLNRIVREKKEMELRKKGTLSCCQYQK